MAGRQLHYCSQPFNCAVLFARPRINNDQILRQHRTLDGTLANWHQLDRAFTFPNRVLLVSQSSVNHTERTKSLGGVWLMTQNLHEFFSRVRKRVAGCRPIATDPGYKTLPPIAREWNVLLITSVLGHRVQRALGRSRIALAQGEEEPVVHENRRRDWVLAQDCLNCVMHRFRICAPFQINPRAPYPARNVLRSYGKHVIQSGGHLLVAAQSFVSKRDLLEYGKIVRVQFQCLVHFLEGFLPATLPPVNVARHQGNSRFVRQRAPGGSQLLPGSIVIRIHPVKVLSESQMRLSRFRAQPANGLHGSFGQLKARFAVIETEEVNPVMRSSQHVISNNERWVAPHSLLKQLHGLE